MTEGCEERMDLAFARWILWDGRTKEFHQNYRRVREQYPEKFVEIRNQRELDWYCREATSHEEWEHGRTENTRA